MAKYSNKTKLTLSLDKDIIQRAKSEGINISEITEKLLASITSTTNSKSYKEEVFRAMEDYDIAVQNLRKAIVKK
jgi:post-segregation antitoxin (ccd killing protein)